MVDRARLCWWRSSRLQLASDRQSCPRRRNRFSRNGWPWERLGHWLDVRFFIWQGTWFDWIGSWSRRVSGCAEPAALWNGRVFIQRKLNGPDQRSAVCQLVILKSDVGPFDARTRTRQTAPTESPLKNEWLRRAFDCFKYQRKNLTPPTETSAKNCLPIPRIPRRRRRCVFSGISVRLGAKLLKGSRTVSQCGTAPNGAR